MTFSADPMYEKGLKARSSENGRPGAGVRASISAGDTIIIGKNRRGLTETAPAGARPLRAACFFPIFRVERGKR